MYYRPQKKLWEGNVFTPVCHSVHGEGGGLCPAEVSVQGGISVTETPRHSGRPGATHPTGVHSHLSYFG